MSENEILRNSKLEAILLSLVLVLPFLNYRRFPPIPDWWTDALSVGLISIALLWCAISLFRESYSNNSQRRVALPIAFVMGSVWLAYIQLLPYLSGNQQWHPVHSTGLIFGLAAGALIYRSSQIQPRQEVINTLAMLLLCGALLQSCIGFAQALGLAPLTHGFLIYDATAQKTAIMGNLAQRNQFAHCLGWGLVAVCYLYGNRKLAAWLTVPSIIVIALLMAWSASRLVWAYGSGFAVFALYWRWRNRYDENLARFVRAAFWAVLAIAITQFFTTQISHFLQWLGLPLEDLGSGISRFTESGLGARRRVEWAKAWQMFLQHPWFGVGIGGYPYQSVWLDTYGGYPPYVEGGLFTHCHNLVMQLLAETGIVGALIAGTGIIWCATSFFRRGQQTCEHLFLASVLMVTLIHSMFEYPLWYLPFFTAFMMCLSLAPVRPLTLTLRPSIRAVFALALGGVGLWYVISGVPVARQLMEWYSGPARTQAEVVARVQGAQRLSLNPFWTYEADSLLAFYIPPTRNSLTQSNITLLTRLTAYRPYPDSLLKLAIMDAYAGKTREAENLLLMALASSPLYTPNSYVQIMDLKDPALVSLQKQMAQAKAVYDKDGPEAVVRWVNTVQRQRGYVLSRD